MNIETVEWREIKLRLTEKINGLHEELESSSTDHDKTQFLRGRIHELRDLLSTKE